jgi:hypothetical protein
VDISWSPVRPHIRAAELRLTYRVGGGGCQGADYVGRGDVNVGEKMRKLSLPIHLLVP